MFTRRIEEQIQESINNATGLDLSREDIHQMKILNDLEVMPHHGMVIALEKGITSILAHVRISGDGQKLEIKSVKTVNW